jgi:hypothetical protein
MSNNNLYFVAVMVKKESTPHNMSILKFHKINVLIKKNALIDYQAFKGNEIIFIGDNNIHIICVQGQVIIKLLNGLEKTILKKIHVFGLKKILFS